MIKMIVACDKNFGIGKDNKLPWPRNKDDMNWFSKNTYKSNVLMGSNTWFSLPKKLINRKNIVVTSKNIEGPDLLVKDLHDYIKNCKEDLWIIGGGSIYSQTFKYIDMLYLTIFDDSFDCDTFIDKNELNKFNKVLEHYKGDKCSFYILSKG